MKTAQPVAISRMAFLLLSLAVAPPIYGAGPGRSLTQPTEVDLFFLCYRFAGVDAPFAALAAREPKAQQADEFKRSQVALEIEGQLRARAQSVADVQFLQLNLRADLGEFDAKYNEYNLIGLGDATYVPSGAAFGRELRIALTNGGEAQTWSLMPSEAEEALRRNHDQRSVSLVMKAEIIGAAPPVDGTPMTLDVKVRELEILGYDQKTRLGKITLR